MDGIHVPLAIPFTRDGAVAHAKLEANVRRYSLSPVAGLVALAPGFEAGALTDDECAGVLRTVRAAASDEKVLVAGVARESVPAALELIGVAEREVFDAVLLVASALHPAEQAMFLRSVADASSLPLMLWGDGLALELVREMAHHANVIGMYGLNLNLERLHQIMVATSDVKREAAVTRVFAPATRRMQFAGEEETSTLVSIGGATSMPVMAQPAMKLRTKAVGFQIMHAGNTAGLLNALETGATGAMAALAACCPQAVYEVYAAFKDGDASLAVEKNKRIVRASELVHEQGIAGIKYGCDRNGYAGGAPRLPRLGLTAVQRKSVEDVLRETPS